eukprot:CAMPEP_0181129508 /NCGR_PEP_ID=MMETSP1071-20121207/29357_1 /TAXON_ID=35127 /ORGANISM="Thalassiosira sp., Strain NH16" /LENGTH=2606 /DNA_ID=CAMNT_0023215495 /DNA_START=157 /DNA_END=7977 /DNA_ORIENTATION=-
MHTAAATMQQRRNNTLGRMAPLVVATATLMLLLGTAEAASIAVDRGRSFDPPSSRMADDADDASAARVRRGPTRPGGVSHDISSEHLSTTIATTAKGFRFAYADVTLGGCRIDDTGNRNIEMWMDGNADGGYLFRDVGSCCASSFAEDEDGCLEASGDGAAGKDLEGSPRAVYQGRHAGIIVVQQRKLGGKSDKSGKHGKRPWRPSWQQRPKQQQQQQQQQSQWQRPRNPTGKPTPRQQQQQQHSAGGSWTWNGGSWNWNWNWNSIVPGQDSTPVIITPAPTPKPVRQQQQQQQHQNLYNDSGGGKQQQQQQQQAAAKGSWSGSWTWNGSWNWNWEWNWNTSNQNWNNGGGTTSTAGGGGAGWRGKSSKKSKSSKSSKYAKKGNNGGGGWGNNNGGGWGGRWPEIPHNPRATPMPVTPANPPPAKTPGPTPEPVAVVPLTPPPSDAPDDDDAGKDKALEITMGGMLTASDLDVPPPGSEEMSTLARVFEQTILRALDDGYACDVFGIGGVPVGGDGSYSAQGVVNIFSGRRGRRRRLLDRRELQQQQQQQQPSSVSGVLFNLRTVLPCPYCTDADATYLAARTFDDAFDVLEAKAESGELTAIFCALARVANVVSTPSCEVRIVGAEYTSLAYEYVREDNDDDEPVQEVTARPIAMTTTPPPTPRPIVPATPPPTSRPVVAPTPPPTSRPVMAPTTPVPTPPVPTTTAPVPMIPDTTTGTPTYAPTLETGMPTYMTETDGPATASPVAPAPVTSAPVTPAPVVEQRPTSPGPTTSAPATMAPVGGGGGGEGVAERPTGSPSYFPTYGEGDDGPSPTYVPTTSPDGSPVVTTDPPTPDPPTTMTTTKPSESTGITMSPITMPSGPITVPPTPVVAGTGPPTASPNAVDIERTDSPTASPVVIAEDLTSPPSTGASGAPSIVPSAALAVADPTAGPTGGGGDTENDPTVSPSYFPTATATPTPSSTTGSSSNETISAAPSSSGSSSNSNSTADTPAPSPTPEPKTSGSTETPAPTTNGGGSIAPSSVVSSNSTTENEETSSPPTISVSSPPSGSEGTDASEEEPTVSPSYFPTATATPTPSSTMGGSSNETMSAAPSMGVSSNSTAGGGDGGDYNPTVSPSYFPTATATPTPSSTTGGSSNATSSAAPSSGSSSNSTSDALAPSPAPTPEPKTSGSTGTPAPTAYDDGTMSIAPTSMPPGAIYHSGFERGTFPRGYPRWSTSETDPWEITTSKSGETDEHAIRSPDLTNPELTPGISNVTFTTDPTWPPGTLVFSIHPGVSMPTDNLVYYVDGVTTGQYADGTEFVTERIELPGGGEHDVTFSYMYNPLSLGVLPPSDLFPSRLGAVYIDDVYYLPAGTATREPTTISTGTDNSSGGPISAAPTVSARPTPAAVPTVPTTYAPTAIPPSIPSGAIYFRGFERGSFPDGDTMWTTSGDAPWYRTDERAASGSTHSIRSPDLGNPELIPKQSNVTFMTDPSWPSGTLHLSILAGVEMPYDDFPYFVDGVLAGQITMDDEFTAAEIPLSAGGPHVVTFSYRYNPSGAAIFPPHEDGDRIGAVFLDDVYFLPEGASSGVSTPPTTTSANVTPAPTEPTSTTSSPAPSPTPEPKTTGSMETPAPTADDGVTSIVPTVGATTPTTIPLVPTTYAPTSIPADIPPGVTYYRGFERGSFPDGDPEWTTSGDAPWEITSERSAAGMYSIRSPNLVSDDRASRTSNVTLVTDPSWPAGDLVASIYPGVVMPFDSVLYYVDDELRGQYQGGGTGGGPSGAGDFETVRISLPPGRSHAVTFSYRYNPLGVPGPNLPPETEDRVGAAYIDEVYFLPAGTASQQTGVPSLSPVAAPTTMGPVGSSVSLQPTPASEPTTVAPTVMPPGSMYFNGFEMGTFPEFDPEWTTRGDDTWEVTSERAKSGAYSIRSPDFFDPTGADVTPKQSNVTLQTNPAWPGGTLVFSVLAGVEMPFDDLQYFVDDMKRGELMTSSFETRSVQLSPGPHTVTFSYRFNPLDLTQWAPRDDDHLGAAFLDDVYFLPEGQTIEPTVAPAVGSVGGGGSVAPTPALAGELSPPPSVSTDDGSASPPTGTLDGGTFFDGFETGDFTALDWQFSGEEGVWMVDSTNPYEGDYSAHARRDDISASQAYASIDISVSSTSSTFLQFYFHAPVAMPFESFSLYVDGNFLTPLNTEDDTWSVAGAILAGGDHDVSWRLTRNPGGVPQDLLDSMPPEEFRTGDAWLDNVQLLPTTLSFVEDWGSGDFDAHPWILSGDGDWSITDSVQYEGTNSATISSDAIVEGSGVAELSIDIITEQGGSLDFRILPSVAPPFEIGNVLIDDLAVLTYSSPGADWLAQQIDIQPGKRRVTFQLLKNPGNIPDENMSTIQEIPGREGQIWLDEIVFTANNDGNIPDDIEGADVPTTSDPTSMPSDAPSLLAVGDAPEGSIEVSISYDMKNTCPGLDASASMSGSSPYNTLKNGLIAASTTVIIDALNTTFPRADDNGEPAGGRRRGIETRGLSRLAGVDSLSTAQVPPSISDDGRDRRGRNLVYYTDDFPVRIDSILDIEDPCDSVNCLLVRTVVTVILDEGDDPAEVRRAIANGVDASFDDETFFGAIPQDTYTC